MGSGFSGSRSGPTLSKLSGLNGAGYSVMVKMGGFYWQNRKFCAFGALSVVVVFSSETKVGHTNMWNRKVFT